MMRALNNIVSRICVRGGEKAQEYVTERSFRQLLQTVKTSLYSTSAVIRQKAVPIVFIESDGTEKEVMAEIGKNLLDVAHGNNVELEGACGGELACSTCHLIFEKSIYDSLPAKTDEEEDMLDLAFEVTETSRLGCQILVRDELSGMKVRIPDDSF
ncbi:hypothetical protein FisN_12Hh217 [Fistulifera solaris]|uniref:2Fe-2S ferredoxin-type domain-containing protein n=1 Tax=Fistulifera solaris TaxID=1519565 RepID=A0A1Z5KBI9_FISSO|nr:hypothetical protein FisN_12Hh217 [Fistulifera solaris]|eukprot:GAX23644.1 hypothetical protein FisN_12Hh217 [Fistulifera solaris]